MLCDDDYENDQRRLPLTVLVDGDPGKETKGEPKIKENLHRKVEADAFSAVLHRFLLVDFHWNFDDDDDDNCDETRNEYAIFHKVKTLTRLARSSPATTLSTKDNF